MSRPLTPAEQRNLLDEKIADGNIRFIIEYEGRIHYANLCVNLLDLGFFFMINGESIIVPFSSIIMPGEPGMMRSIFVRDRKTDQDIVAKFIDFHDLKSNGEEHEEPEFFFKVVIRGDDSDVRVVSLADIVPIFPTVQQGLAQEESFKVRKAELEARKARNPRLQFPMALPPSPKHTGYPHLVPMELMILFHLCQKHGFKMGNNYPFNILLIRFLACGTQEKFFHEVPQLTTSERECFNAFQERYNEQLMGTVMVSDIQRCSKFSVQKVFLLQFAIMKAQRISSLCALKLSRKYYTFNEPGVVLCKGDGFVPHSSLKRLE